MAGEFKESLKNASSQETYFLVFKILLALILVLGLFFSIRFFYQTINKILYSKVISKKEMPVSFKLKQFEKFAPRLGIEFKR